MITPTGHHVLVEPLDITEGVDSEVLKDFKIVHGDEELSKRAQQYGVIVAVGFQAWQSNVDYDEQGGMHRGKPWAKAGDVVLFPMYAGKWVEDNFTGEELMMLNDTDIKAIISEGENPKFEKPKFGFKTKTK